MNYFLCGVYARRRIKWRIDLMLGRSKTLRHTIGEFKNDRFIFRFNGYLISSIHRLA